MTRSVQSDGHEGADATDNAPEAERALSPGLCLVSTVAIVLAPLLAQAFGNGVGSFSMFTKPVLYRVQMVTELPDGSRRPLPMKRLLPHLGRDARRVVGNASEWFFGETQVNLLASGLADLATLVCRVEPSARAAYVLLERDDPRHEEIARDVVALSCDEPRR